MKITHGKSLIPKNKRLVHTLKGFESSNILKVLYFKSEKILVIEFHKQGKFTGRYKYKDVSYQRFLMLGKAESKGKYFNSKIRGRYETTKMS